MDSSMPQQMADKLFFLRPLLPLMRLCEGAAVRGAVAVVAVCDALAESARKYGARKVAVLRDVSLLHECGAPSKDDLRLKLDIRGTCLMYVGNLERYQGVDLLLESFAVFAPANQAATLVIVGGDKEHIKQYVAKAGRLGIKDRVRFTGTRPLEEMPALFAAADILMSPRTKGTNTPMKIYSYLHSGKAVLATDIVSHTQVLGPDTAMLTPPRRPEFAAAMKTLVEDTAMRGRLGANGKALVETRYSRKQFAEAVRELYAWLSQITSGQLPQGGQAPGSASFATGTSFQKET
jgi:glycosyltransferase involved in cell wall biosynthesis